mmetsp:Transcript_104587/g.253871  ORF Transcript_104587/g.253871 Transcript_104587/m.253871 type:complete len:230 (+) Transcript_104587:108-797(+)
MQAHGWQLLGCPLHCTLRRPRHTWQCWPFHRKPSPLRGERAREPVQALVEAAGLRSLLGGQGAREPVEALVEAIAGGRTRGLDEPLAVSEVVQPQLLGHFRGSHGIRQVLLVGKDQQHSVAHLIFVQHLGQLLPCVFHAVAVVAVDHVDEAVGALVVVAPEGPDLVLAADVPHRERDVLVLDGLDVEADRGDGGDHLTQLQLVQDGGLASGIQTDHQDAHLLLAEHAVP